MKYRATFLSALVLPGLGQILCAKDSKDKLRGWFILFLTTASISIYLIFVVQEVMRAMPPPESMPDQIPQMIRLSLEITDRVYGQLSKKTVLLLVFLTPLWGFNVWDAFRLDRR
jgi:hypothetical protein